MIIKSQSLIVKRDLLEIFIKTDITNDSAILNYLRKYNIVTFEKSTSKVLEDFRTEHSQLYPIYIRATTGDLTEGDLRVINKKIVTKNDLLTWTTDENVIALDKHLAKLGKKSFDEQDIKSNDTYRFMRDYTYTDSYTFLWDALIDRLTKNTYKTCTYCGLFFPFDRRSKKFCTPKCKAQYAYNKSYKILR
ncbi:MAG: hypothetical protein R3B92_02805 [Patescibacteria group bacterium]